MQLNQKTPADFYYTKYNEIKMCLTNKPLNLTFVGFATTIDKVEGS